jgi:hypothetical protein
MRFENSTYYINIITIIYHIKFAKNQNLLWEKLFIDD